jgi:hypothetical protein
VAWTLGQWKNRAKALEKKITRMQQRVEGGGVAVGREAVEVKARGRPKGSVQKFDMNNPHNLKRHVKRLLEGNTTDGDAAWTELVGLVLNSKRR